VGNFPVGYRSWRTNAAGRLKLVESVQCARVLADTGVAYISVMGNLRIFLPADVIQAPERRYMADLRLPSKKR